MAEIRLKANWAGYPPGKIVSVSETRAKYLVGLKIAKYTVEQAALNKEKLVEEFEEEFSDNPRGNSSKETKGKPKGKGK